MEKIKGLFVKKRAEEFEVLGDVETRVTEGPKESRVGGLYNYAKGLIVKRPPPRLITPYAEMTDMLGMRVPALRFFSANPYGSMDAYSTEGNVPLTLLPNVPYPICWQPIEHWQHRPMLDETERKIKFPIPLGRTYAVRGMMKRVVTEAWASVNLTDMPWGLSRLGIVGRDQFDLDVISGDFDTRTELAQQRYQIERLKAMKSERSFREVVESTRGMPEAQKTYTYDSLLRSLGLGGTKELLESDDPEAKIDRAIEFLVEQKNKYGGSKR